MAFGGDNDIQIKVSLEEGQAVRGLEKVEGAIRDVNRAAGDSPKAVGGAEGSILSLGSVAAKASIIVGTLTTAFAGFKKAIDLGDALGDVRDGFNEAAAAAGVLGDTLLTSLQRATKGTVTDLDLMKEAAKGLQLGIPAEQIDDLALAAQRFADKTNQEFIPAFTQLVQAVNTGRESSLKYFGTVKDGTLIIDTFTESQAQALEKSKGLADIFSNVAVRVQNATAATGAYINENRGLINLITNLYNGLAKLAEFLGKVGQAFVNLIAIGIEPIVRKVEEAVFQFNVLGKILGQISNGEMPSYEKAVKEAFNDTMPKATANVEKAEKAVIKFGKGTDGAADKVRNIKKALAEAFEDQDIKFNDLLGLESFSLGENSQSLRSAIRTAFESIRPEDIKRDLDRLQGVFLDGLLGDPVKNADEIKRRLSQFYAEVAVIAEEERKNALKVPDLLGGYTKQDLEGPGGLVGQGADLLGIDVSGMSDELAASIESAITTALDTAFDAIINGISRDMAPQLGAELGQSIGELFGPLFGTLGKYFGQAIGEFIAQAGDSAGTETRKQIDKYFADVFSADRISVVINGQLQRINDLVFEGNTPFGGNVSFGGEGFFDLTRTMSEGAQAGVTAVGAAFGQLLGVAEEQSRLIGGVFINNVGTSLQNLQLLVQATGESFQELGDAIIEAFYNGVLSIQEAYEGLAQLQTLFEVGIPGAVGAVDEAINNFQVALADGRGSRALIDSLRDIGAEANDIGSSLQSVAQRVGSTLGFSTQQIARLFEAMRAVGISSVNDLAQASTAQLIALAENIRRIRDDIAGIVSAPTDPSQTITPPSNFTAGAPVKTSSGSKSGTSDAEKRAKKLREEQERAFQTLYKLVTASKEYEKILEAINNEQLTQRQGTKEIRELFDQVKSATKELEKAEEAYQKALKKRKGNLAEASKAVEDAKKKLEELTDTGKKAGVIPKFDISGAVKLVQTINEFAVIAKAAGVTLESMTSTLVEGFLRGRTSLRDFRAELDKIQETMGDGIPGAIGAVSEAIKNLFEGGQNGGIFSIDAFKDVFAEFEELFGQNASERRRDRLNALRKDFDDANKALQDAINSGATPAELDEFRKRFEDAQEALRAFENGTTKAGLEDLRDELRKTLTPKQVDAFFAALEKNGITSFEDVKNAGSGAITQILADLDEMGFDFGETSERVKEIIKNLDDAAKAQTDGKDVLGEALNLVKDFNTFSGKLPDIFRETGDRVKDMEGPLAAISTQVSNVVNQLSALRDNQFNNDIVFNVKVNGESSAVALVDVLYGDGSGTIGDTGGNAGPGTGGDTPSTGGTPKTRTKPVGTIVYSKSRPTYPGTWTRLSPGIWKRTA